jgi:hypothetical protein
MNLIGLLHNRPSTKQKGALMIIDWVAAKVQYFLPEQNAGIDEFNFDFALSPEIMGLLHAQNEDGMDTAVQIADDAEAEKQYQTDMIAITQFALDEYEMALA